MIKKVFSLRDTVCDLFLNCTIEDNEKSAIRNFENAMLHEGTLMHTHGDTFELVYIADFNTQTGEVIPVPHKVVKVGNANR